MEKREGSKLLQMKARFQQKQLQERELKIASLYEAQQARALDRVRHSPSSRPRPSPPPEPPMPVHPGKVRQMFEERRTKAGIDKSYPLQPIHNTDRARKPLPNGFSKVTTSSSTGSTKVSTTTRTVVDKKKQGPPARTKKLQQHKTENMVNGSGDLNHNHKPDLNAAKRTLPRSKGELISGIDELDRNDNNYLLENETFPDALEPAPTPRSPEPRRPPRRNPASRTSPPAKSPTQPVAPPRRAASDNVVLKNNKPKEAMQCSVNPPLRKHPLSGSRAAGPVRAAAGRKTAESRSAVSPPGEGVACAVCGRHFAADRIDRHQDICRRASTKKRKPFDALKHRLAGTEAEPFISKLRKKAGTASNSATKVDKSLNNNWRQKHEEFIQAIRAAKQVQQHLKAGGKLSDLPPPPPSENPDYVQCPHCKRRFNEAAAERHIPKCAGFQFNKAKSPPKGSRR